MTAGRSIILWTIVLLCFGTGTAYSQVRPPELGAKQTSSAKNPFSAQKPAGQFILAVAEMKAGRFHTARRILERIVKANPNHLAARNNLAVCLVKQRQYAEAEKHLQYVLRIAPGRAGTRQNMGVLMQETDRNYLAESYTGDAVAQFSQQNATARHRAAALFNRGWLLDEQARFEEAVEAYQGAVAIAPKYVRAWIGLSIALAQTARFVDALQSLDQAAKFQGKNSTWSALIDANREAIIEAQKARKSQPTPSPSETPKAGNPQTADNTPADQTPADATPSPAEPTGFLQQGLFGMYLGTTVGVIIYIVVQLFLIGLSSENFGGGKGGVFFLCLILSGGVFVLCWGTLHWIVLAVVSILSASLAAAAD